MTTTPINKIKSNPNNPRVIKDDKFKKLVQSLKDLPEMAQVRPIVVNQDMIVLGGNMRLKAMKEAGWKEAPVAIVDWDEDKQRQFIIKDNVGFGEWDWDMLANEWDDEQLNEWGLDTIKHDWKELDYIEEEISAPKLKNENEITISVTEEWMDSIRDIESDIKNLLSDKYSGCDIK
jgi:ParB-like chromosome segregation protein Spo0J